MTAPLPSKKTISSGGFAAGTLASAGSTGAGYKRGHCTPLKENTVEYYIKNDWVIGKLPRVRLQGICHKLIQRIKEQAKGCGAVE
jgi:hypothetical protein